MHASVIGGVDVRGKREKRIACSALSFQPFQRRLAFPVWIFVGGARRVDMVAADLAAQLQCDGQEAERGGQAGHVAVLADEQVGREVIAGFAVVAAIGELGIAAEHTAVLKDHDRDVFAEAGL